MPMIGRRPSMTAYKPTVRDMVARQALNLFGDTYANRKLMRNMFGSSGIGSTGEASLADFTPAGVGFAADEAGRLAGQGRPLQAAANLALAAVPIPAVAKGAKGMIGKAGRKIMQAAPSPGITAYHGSPHTFDQFSLDKIGTGEGAQAYGHGLYFAENEGVAKSYRDLHPASALDPTDTAGFEARAAFDVAKGDERAALAHIAKRRAETVAASGFLVDGGKKTLADLDDAASRIAAGEFKKGSMYQVRINADPNDFLDWDALLSDQPPVLQDIARKADLSHIAPGNRTRRQIEMWRDGTLPNKISEPTGNVLHNALTDYGADPTKNAALTNELAKAGIPGIKYLDRGSRGAGEGSRNFVVFDPKIIDIMKRYGVAAPVAAAILAGTVPRPAEAKDQPNLFRQPGQ